MIEKQKRFASLTVVVLMFAFVLSVADAGKWWLGSPAAWGQEIIAEMERIEALVYREQTVFNRGSQTHVSGNWDRIYQAADRSRDDMYFASSDESTIGDNNPDSVLVRVTWEVSEGNDVRIYLVDHEYKCYKIMTEKGRAYKRDPMKELRSYVGMLDKADRMLDTRTFDGHECIGFEIDRSKDADAPKGRTDRIWLDVKTKLPVRIEKHGCPIPGHSGMTRTSIHDRFKYHVQIPAEDFEPKIPDGFLNAHPDELPGAIKRQRREQAAGTVSEAGEQSGNSVSTVESTKVDIAIGDGNFLVTKLSDRVFEIAILLHNRGSVPIPRFKVYFYAGDPDKGGRLLSAQNAGPIMPGDTWAEYNPGLELRPGENVISVIVDPDNKVEESDETNNKVSKTISTIVSESATVRKVGAIQKLDLSGDDTVQVEAQSVEGFNFPYYLFIPGGIDKRSPVYMLVEPNNSGMVSDDLEVHRTKALALVKKSHANRMAKRLGVPLLAPTFPRPHPETHSWAYTHALDIDTLEIAAGKLKRVDLQLTAMIKHAQELLRTNGFKINDKIFMHGFSASAKFCNRYSYLHPEMVKAAAAGGVNGLPTLPVREWNGYELPFPIGLAGIERFASKPFDDKAFMQVAHYIYMGSSDRNDTLLSREAWREEEADIIRKALAAPEMMPDRWELSRKIYRQQKLPAQLVTYNGVGHSIKSQMLDDVIDFFKANAGEKYVRIEPYEYPPVKVKEIRPKSKTESARIDIAIDDSKLTVTKQPDGSFRAEIAIWNKGSRPLPEFGVCFYAGDPDKGGRLLAPHAAGPIMPDDGWGEYNPSLKLKPSEDTIVVVVDPDNKVTESNETNNKASQVIPGR